MNTISTYSNIGNWVIRKSHRAAAKSTLISISAVSVLTTSSTLPIYWGPLSTRIEKLKFTWKYNFLQNVKYWNHTIYIKSTRTYKLNFWRNRKKTHILKSLLSFLSSHNEQTNVIKSDYTMGNTDFYSIHKLLKFLLISSKLNVEYTQRVFYR